MPHQRCLEVTLSWVERGTTRCPAATGSTSALALAKWLEWTVEEVLAGGKGGWNQISKGNLKGYPMLVPFVDGVRTICLRPSAETRIRMQVLGGRV